MASVAAFNLKKWIDEDRDVLLIPPNLPHSPQRFADTVVERKRREGEIDHKYYGDEKLRTCEKCGWVEPPKGTPAAAKAS